MKRLVFSSVFEADFAEITAQLAVVASPEVSVRWEEAIIRLAGRLQKFPHLGRIRRDLHPAGIRTFGVKEFPNFLVFYRTTANEIVFLRVRYGGMDLTRMFSKE
jgi:plasmid stabilization system protein ParE